MKDLTNYSEGKGCKCSAWSDYECGCNNVDWTPKEVYELRNMVEELEAKLVEANKVIETMNKWTEYLPIDKEEEEVEEGRGK